MELIKPEEVTVVRRALAMDDLGEPNGETETAETVMCVVAPGATADLAASRPNGVSVAYTLHFPKGYTESLYRAHVLVRGEEFAVVGDPKPYSDANTPGRYNRAVEVTCAYG